MSSTNGKTTARGGERLLTNGEIVMAKAIFKGAINYSSVRIHNDEYFAFGMQDDDTAVTPNGEMYWPEKHFKEDYSVEGRKNRRWFMHEMTHIWQYNMGISVLVNGITSGIVTKYELQDYKLLSDFRIESQANIIADYYVLKNDGITEWNRWNFLETNPYTIKAIDGGLMSMISMYEIVLKLFLNDPTNKDILFHKMHPESDDTPFRNSR